MKVQKLLLVTLSITFAACAGQTYRAEVGPMFARARGVFALGDSGGSPLTNNSINGNLGLGDTEVSPYLAARTDIDRHRIRVNGFYLNSEGSGTTAPNGPGATASYGNITGGTAVQTTMDFFAIASNYTYEVFRDERYRVGLGVQLGYYSLDVSASDGTGREQVTTDVVVPMPYVEAEAIWRDLTVGASMGIMSADLGDANGRYWDIEAYANWALSDQFDIKGGYRYLLLDGYGRASSRDFDADVNVQGLFLSAGIRF